ncbi:MAG: hypothetical protein D6696_18040 [Acidobacteria bacterium]|nr:MAG: hypothetical protein D6696_18040 [Acidobacteriota bacterium]
MPAAPPADDGAACASPATLAALQLPELLGLLAADAATDLGRQRIAAVRPFRCEEALRQHRRRFEEADRLAAERPLVPACEQPFDPVLAALDEGGELDGRDLVLLADLLRIAVDARRRIDGAEPPCPALAERVAALSDLAPLIEAIDRALDRRGAVRDDASPELVRLRGRIQHARERLYADLSGYVEQHREHLGEETIPMRGGRLMLLLQAGARGRLAGLTHGRSGRGKSFYFEPLEAVELNNRLQQAREDEEAERRRILRQLIARVEAARAEVAQAAELVTELDQLQVYARYRQTTGGRLAELGPRHELELVGARHPLLDPALAEQRRVALGTAGHRQPVVPLDLSLSTDQRVLVITGPNAGGKTVALKTVGLLALSHLCGLPLPAAAGSRLPFFDAIVATVGDEQDLLADRSTFSGRLLRLREAWEAAGPDALILLDELGSGTDPEEGAALAVALLEALAQRRALTLATTHLLRVAAVAQELEGALCAAMAFDAETGRPTYRLRTGPPGGSEALALARRLGLPDAWLARAEELLGEEHRSLQRLLEEVEASRRALDAERRALAVERADAERLRRRLAEREAALAEEKRRLAGQLRGQLEAFRRRVQERLRDELERLARAAGASAAKRRQAVGEATARLFAGAPQPAEEESAAAAPPRVGGAVRHRRLGWQGVLERLDRGKAQVRVAGKILRCREEDLAAAGEAPPAPRAAAVSTPEPDADEPRELKLIGLRVEPALDRLERFLDRSLLAGLPEVRIVHGHGSGQLKRAVRERLRRHPAVAGQRPGGKGEGGDGATVVRLRG